MLYPSMNASFPSWSFNSNNSLDLMKSSLLIYPVIIKLSYPVFPPSLLQSLPFDKKVGQGCKVCPLEFERAGWPHAVKGGGCRKNCPHTSRHSLDRLGPPWPLSVSRFLRSPPKVGHIQSPSCIAPVVPRCLMLCGMFLRFEWWSVAPWMWVAVGECGQ